MGYLDIATLIAQGLARSDTPSDPDQSLTKMGYRDIVTLIAQGHARSDTPSDSDQSLTKVGSGGAAALVFFHQTLFCYFFYITSIWGCEGDAISI